ncbi:MAG: hypothetical protein WC375_00315 [Methanomassiliicoccales archaeon]|jgi:hypothetical protein
MSKNPYREDSNYAKLFEFIQKAGKITREALIKFARQTLKLSDGASNASVTVMLSPRAESTRGDCRGNISAAGHVYYMEKLSRPLVAGEKGEQEYRLRWRNPELEPKTRDEKKDAKGKTKVTKAKAKVAKPKVAKVVKTKVAKVAKPKVAKVVKTKVAKVVTAKESPAPAKKVSSKKTKKVPAPEAPATSLPHSTPAIPEETAPVTPETPVTQVTEPTTA